MALGNKKETNFKAIIIDLKSRKNYIDEIKQILDKHPDWYLGSYFHREWDQKNIGNFCEKHPHIVAYFYLRDFCVPIDRGDGLRWGLRKAF